MNLDKILEQVDTEQMYQHVLNLEGIKHPLDTPEKLKEAADYIYSTLKGYGASIRMQEFQLEGFPDPLINVEGWIGDKNDPAAVIASHYDTVYSTPGANDNAAAIAVMLEAARILAQEDDVPPVRFVSFTLEEGNPVFEAKIRASAQKLGLTDDRQRPTSYRAAKIIKEHSKLGWKIYDEGRAGKTYAEALAEATSQLDDGMPEAVFKHLQEKEAIYASLTSIHTHGTTGLVGSWAWVDDALKSGTKIKYAIVLDEIGRTRQQEGSQTLPPELTYEMMQTFKVDAERNIGDWAFIITDGAAEKLGQTLCTLCERESIALPYGYFNIPLNYEGIVQQFPQSLHSDHASFWNAGIPALFLFDTANWRLPYVGHTMADTIDILDFEQITKICKAVIATVVDPTL